MFSWILISRKHHISSLFLPVLPDHEYWKCFLRKNTQFVVMTERPRNSPLRLFPSFDVYKNYFRCRKTDLKSPSHLKSPSQLWGNGTKEVGRRDTSRSDCGHKLYLAPSDLQLPPDAAVTLHKHKGITLLHGTTQTKTQLCLLYILFIINLGTFWNVFIKFFHA